MKKQRITNVPFHHRDQTQTILHGLEHKNIIARVGLEAGNNIERQSEFIKAFVMLPKADTHRIFIDARLLKGMTDVWK